MSVARWGEGQPLLATTAMMIAFVLFALSVNAAQAFILYLIIGICLAAWPVVTTSAQHLTEQTYQGRVQSVVNAVSGVAVLLVYSVVGGASTLVSVRWSYASIVIISALASIVALHVYFEPPRLFWRLQLLRRWSQGFREQRNGK